MKKNIKTKEVYIGIYYMSNQNRLRFTFVYCNMTYVIYTEENELVNTLGKYDYTH